MSDVKRYLASRIPSCSYNAPEYVLASDYDALRSRLAATEGLLNEMLPCVLGAEAQRDFRKRIDAHLAGKPKPRQRQSEYDRKRAEEFGE